MASQRRQGETTAQIHARVYAARLDRLSKLIDLEYDGKLADMIGTSDIKNKRSMSSFISQLMSGNRPLGEQAARKIEVACGKPAGWLDGIDDPVMADLEAAALDRVKRFKRILKKSYEGSLDVLAETAGVGARRATFLADVLAGKRYLSANNAIRLESELGLSPGALQGEATDANESV